MKAVALLEASHLFIGCMAALLTLETYVAFELDTDIRWMLAIGLGTSLFYTIHRLWQLLRYKDAQDDRMRLLENYQREMRLFVVIWSIGFLVVLWPYFQSIPWTALVICGMLGLYVLPWNRKGRSLRDLPYVKVILISLGWSYATYALPMALQDIELELLPLFERFVFFLLITLPFDVRDQAIDEAIGLKTVAQRLSKPRLRSLLFVLWIIHVGLLIYAPMSIQYRFVLGAVSGVGLCMGWYSWGRTWPYFSFGMDGLIGLRCVMLMTLL